MCRKNLHFHRLRVKHRARSELKGFLKRPISALESPFYDDFVERKRGRSAAQEMIRR